MAKYGNDFYLGEMGIRVHLIKYLSNGALVQAFGNLRVTSSASALSRLLPGFLSFASASATLACARAGLDDASFF